MASELYFVRLATHMAFVVMDLYLLGLWCFALMRTGRMFFWILAISAAGSLFIAMIGTALSCYDSKWWEHIVGPGPFRVFYEVFLAVQPLNFFLAIIGYTILVQWILASQRVISEPAKV
jgi:hypothetical protein